MAYPQVCRCTKDVPKITGAHQPAPTTTALGLAATSCDACTCTMQIVSAAELRFAYSFFLLK